MGLDMYLNRAVKVEGFSLQELNQHSNNLNKIIEEDGELHEKLKPFIVKRGDEDFNWPSLFPEVGYWRKENAIHKWFVDNVQEGTDDCGMYEVSKEKVEELRDLCKKVLEDRSLADKLLPSKSGFFFGSTDYNEWYFRGLENTVQIMDRVLEEVDFDNNFLVYRSSW